MDQNRVAELWNKAVEEVGDATYPTIIARFAALVAADEREACAKVCESLIGQVDEYWRNKRPDEAAEFDASNVGKQACADAIRMRSNVELSGASPLAGAASARTQG